MGSAHLGDEHAAAGRGVAAVATMADWQSAIRPPAAVATDRQIRRAAVLSACRDRD